MKKTVVVRLFRFDAKSDYLSYYKPYKMKLSTESSAADIFEEVRAQDPLFRSDTTSVDTVLIDSVAFGIDEALGENLQEEMVIEPVATDRAKEDFELNEDDFWEKFDLFSQWTDESDREFYNCFKSCYYLSDYRRINKAYVGEAAFVLADRLIKANAANELDILRIIADEDSGIWHYGTLSAKFNTQSFDLDTLVLKLKRKAIDYGVCDVARHRVATLVDKYEESNDNFFGENLGFKSFDTSKFHGLKVAVYIGNYSKKFRHLDVTKLLQDGGVDLVNTASVDSYCGFESFDINPEIFDIAASKIVEDAVDNDAAILISPWKDVVELLRSRKGEIQCVAGRDLKIEFVHTSEII